MVGRKKMLMRDKLKPFKHSIKGQELGKHIEKTFKLSKDSYKKLIDKIVKAKTDVLTDGRRFYTIGRIGHPGEYKHYLYLLRFKGGQK